MVALFGPLALLIAVLGWAWSGRWFWQIICFLPVFIVGLRQPSGWVPFSLAILFAILHFLLAKEEERHTALIEEDEKAFLRRQEKLKGALREVRKEYECVEAMISSVSSDYEYGRLLLNEVSLTKILEQFAGFLSVKNLFQQAMVAYLPFDSSVAPLYFSVTAGQVNSATPDLFSRLNPLGKISFGQGNIVLAVIENPDREAEVAEFKERVLYQFLQGFARGLLFRDIQRLAIHDTLTGLFLRQYFLEKLSEELTRIKVAGGSCSLFMADIDHFKQFNDTYGHSAGDFVLRRVAAALQDSLRKIDLLARYGGEEFIGLLPATSIADAELVMNRCREAIASQEHTFQGKRLPQITISIGLSVALSDIAGSELVKNADAALYRAKASGRNCVKQFV